MTICKNTSSFLAEAHDIAANGDQRDINNLPQKIGLLREVVDKKVIVVLEEALQFYRNFRLAENMLSAKVAENNKQSHKQETSTVCKECNQKKV